MSDRMNILSPSILAADFVPSISFGMPVIKSIRKVTKKIFDVHLMIVDPERFVKEFAECGADSITFHIEATEDVDEIIDQIHSLGCRAGMAIKPKTPTEVVRKYLSKVDMLLVMTVEPGFGGQKYIPESTERIREIRHMAEEMGIDLDIQVDGGITEENISVVLDAGANVIVAGSSVFRGNVTENVQKLMAQF